MLILLPRHKCCEDEMCCDEQEAITRNIIADTKSQIFTKSLSDEQTEIDWPFMEESGKVLSDLPDTWKAYNLDTIKGRCDVIDMEYNELKKAVSKEEKMHELVHLASACLFLWRKLNEMPDTTR